MEKRYVTLETARVLKDFGFDEWCNHFYGTDIRYHGESLTFDEEGELKDEGLGDEIERVEGGILINLWSNNGSPSEFAAPEIDDVLYWLRTNYAVFVRPIQTRLYECRYEIYYHNGFHSYVCDKVFYTYEEAMEDAIRYAVGNILKKTNKYKQENEQLH